MAITLNGVIRPPFDVNLRALFLREAALAARAGL